MNIANQTKPSLIKRIILGIWVPILILLALNIVLFSGNSLINIEYQEFPDQHGYHLRRSDSRLEISRSYSYITENADYEVPSHALAIEFYQYIEEDSSYQIRFAIVGGGPGFNSSQDDNDATSELVWNSYRLLDDNGNNLRNIEFPRPFGGGSAITEYLIIKDPLPNKVTKFVLDVSSRITLPNGVVIFRNENELIIPLPDPFERPNSVIQGFEDYAKSFFTSFDLFHSLFLSFGILGIFTLIPKKNQSSSSSPTLLMKRVKEGGTTLAETGTVISTLQKENNQIPWSRYLIYYFGSASFLILFNLSIHVFLGKSYDLADRYLETVLTILGAIWIICTFKIAEYIFRGVLTTLKLLYNRRLFLFYKHNLVNNWHVIVIIISTIMNFIIIFTILFQTVDDITTVPIRLSGLIVVGIILQGIIISVGFNGYYQNDLVFNTRKLVIKYSKSNKLSLFTGFIIAVNHLVTIILNIAITTFTLTILMKVNTGIFDDMFFIEGFVNSFNNTFLPFLLEDSWIFVFAIVGHLFGAFAFYLEQKGRTNREDVQYFYSKMIPILIFGNLLIASLGFFMFAISQSIGFAAGGGIAFVEFQLIIGLLQILLWYLFFLMLMNTLGQIFGLWRLKEGLIRDLDNSKLSYDGVEKQEEELEMETTLSRRANFCTKCGNPLNEGVKFCTTCGEEVN